MNIARSTFYHKHKAKSPDRMETEADLSDRIEALTKLYEMQKKT